MHARIFRGRKRLQDLVKEMVSGVRFVAPFCRNTLSQSRDDIDDYRVPVCLLRKREFANISQGAQNDGRAWGSIYSFYLSLE